MSDDVLIARYDQAAIPGHLAKENVFSEIMYHVLIYLDVE